VIDFQTLMLDPIYATLGVPASITIPADGSSDELTITDLTVIDKTSGLTVGEHDAQVTTIEPACCIRRAELDANGLSLASLDRASIEFNGSRWTIKGTPKRPIPNGAKKGEILLLLGNEVEISDSPSSDSPSSDSPSSDSPSSDSPSSDSPSSDSPSSDSPSSDSPSSDSPSSDSPSSDSPSSDSPSSDPPPPPDPVWKFGQANQLASYGVGYFTNNSASPSLATKWGFSKTNALGDDMTSFLDSLAALSGSPHKAQVTMTNRNNGTFFTFYIDSVDTTTGNRYNFNTSPAVGSNFSGSFNHLCDLTFTAL
jgi:hypothetical protein